VKVHVGAGEEMELTEVEEESELKGVNFAKLTVGKLVVGAEQVKSSGASCSTQQLV
jgi:hypothetical protein